MTWTFSCLSSLLYIRLTQRHPWGRPGSLPKVTARKRRRRMPSHPCLAQIPGSFFPCTPPPGNPTQASTRG